MEKIVYLLWGEGSPEGGDALRTALLGEVAPSLLDAGVRGLSCNVHDSEAARAPSPAPTPNGEEPLVAQVSVWLDSYDRRPGVDEAIGKLGRRWAAYLVTESLYEDYGSTPHAPARNWDDGVRSPGVLTVSLIHRPADLAEAEWIERWHGTQSPLSGRLQPRCRYVRNQVIRALTPGAPAVDGIVEEAWASPEVVADPMLFFSAKGDAQVLEANITAMLESVAACLDLARLRNVTMSEYLLRSL